MAPRSFDKSKPPSCRVRHQVGVLRKSADDVAPARKGEVMHADAAEEVVCYADI